MVLAKHLNKSLIIILSILCVLFLVSNFWLYSTLKSRIDTLTQEKTNLSREMESLSNQNKDLQTQLKSSNSISL